MVFYIYYILIKRSQNRFLFNIKDYKVFILYYALPKYYFEIEFIYSLIIVGSLLTR